MSVEARELERTLLQLMNKEVSLFLLCRSEPVSGMVVSVDAVMVALVCRMNSAVTHRDDVRLDQIQFVRRAWEPA